MKYLLHYDSPLGPLNVLEEDDAITALWFEDDHIFPLDPGEDAVESPTPLLLRTEKWLDDFFAGKDPGPVPPVRFRGTAFQKEVWELLLTIPYGTTVSYGDIAEILAVRRGIPKMAAQAVGGAVGKNPISLLVPCHRVIGADGSMVGYGSGGVRRKEKLLALEK